MKEKLKKILLSIERRNWEGEVYFREGKRLEIRYKNGELESVRKAEQRGIGVRIFKGKKMVFFDMPFSSEKEIERLISKAESLLPFAEEDEGNVLYEPNSPYFEVEHFDPEITRIDKRYLQSFLLDYKAYILTESPSLWYLSGSTGVSKRIILSSQGVELFDESTHFGVGFSVYFEKDGERWEAGDFISVRRLSDFDKLDFRGRIKRESKRAKRMVGAGPVETQTLPVLYDLHPASRLARILVSLLDGEDIYYKESLISSNDIGKKLFSDKITLIEDGTFPFGLRSAPFDDEGVPIRKKTLIDKGVIKETLENVRSSRLNKKSPTGNGFRGSYRSLPGIFPTNLLLIPGEKQLSDIISSIDKGFYCLGTIGFGVDTTSGNYSTGAYGFMVEKGELTRSVARVTLGSDLKHMFSSIQELSKEVDLSKSTRAPAILITDVRIGGKQK